MKQSKIRGYIKDLENKNKKFSYDKTIKLLDVSNYVYLELINKIDYSKISDYKQAKYIYKEIHNEFNTIYELLSNGEVLMGACLLRNTYEEILYIMATTLNINLDINAKTKAGYFKDIVIENINDLLSDSIEETDLKEIYSYLSKIIHVTNLKEAISYLVGNRDIKKYIINEIKFVLILIEYLYLDFLYKKLNLDRKLIDNIIAISSYPEIINTLYYSANSNKLNKKLMIYFYGDKNQKYLKDSQDRLISELKSFKVEKNNIDLTIKQISKEIDKQLSEMNYLDKANEILNS